MELAIKEIKLCRQERAAELAPSGKDNSSAEDIYFSKKADKIIENGLGKTYTLEEIKKKHNL